MTKLLLSLLFLMCENVNAAPQAGHMVITAASQEAHGAGLARAATDPQRGLNRDLSAGTRHSEPDGSATKPAIASSQDGASQGTAPILLLSHPMCQTGFTIAMRYDERNSAGAIIKSVWVRKCARAPKLTWRSK